VTDNKPLFERTGGWRFARIDPFDRAQQERYLQGLYQGDFEAQFPDYESVKELLELPVVLAMIRGLAKDGFPEFRTRGDLYLKVHDHVTERDAIRLGKRPDFKSQVSRYFRFGAGLPKSAETADRRSPRDQKTHALPLQPFPIL
jgi:hypothetical protein